MARTLRARLAGFGGVAGLLLLAPVAGADGLSVDPPAPGANDVVVVTVQQAGVCRVWTDSPQIDTNNGVITLNGHTLPDPCTAELAQSLAVQGIVLDFLPYGSYGLSAVADGQVVFTGGFDVGQPWGGPNNVVYVTPSLPAAGDRIVTFGLPVGCSHFQGPAVVRGRLIVLDYVYFGGIIGECPPFPSDETRRDLGPLSAGTYEVVESPLSGFVQVAPFPQRGLALQGGRFEVEVLRPSILGNPQPVTAPGVQLAGNAGYFWFFDASSVEVAVKILDGRPVNGHFWVFVGSMTDQPFTVVVTEQGCSGSTCPARTYISPAGVNRNFIDVLAFSGELP